MLYIISKIRLYNNTNNPWLDKMSTVIGLSLARAKRRHPTCSYATLWWFLHGYTYQPQMILKPFASQTENRGWTYFFRNGKSPQKYRKNNNTANCIEIFNIPTILVVMCTSHSVSDPRYQQEWYFISCFMLSYTGLIL